MEEIKPEFLFLFLFAYLLLRFSDDITHGEFALESPLPRLSLLLIAVGCTAIFVAGICASRANGSSRRRWYRLSGLGFLLFGIEWYFDMLDASIAFPSITTWFDVVIYLFFGLYLFIGLWFLLAGVQTLRGSGRFALVPPDRNSQSG